MLDLFKENYNPKLTQVSNTGFYNIKKGYQRNLLNVINYYRFSNFSLANDHILVRILRQILMPLNTPLEKVVNRTDDQFTRIVSLFGLSSLFYDEQLFKGFKKPNFYKDDKEVIFCYNEFINPFEDIKTWYNLTPLKVLRHGTSSLNLELTDGLKIDSTEGVILLLDITKLNFMYHCYRLHYYKEHNVEPEVGKFITKFVLPNMLPSHLDHVIINRLYNKHFTISNDNYVINSRVPQVNYETNFNLFINYLDNELKTRSFRFENRLCSIPAISKVNQLKNLIIPNLPYTRRSLWIPYYARSKILALLFSYDSYVKSNQNDMVNHVRRDITVRINQKDFNPILNSEYGSLFQRDVLQILGD